MDTAENSRIGKVKSSAFISEHYVLMMTGRMMPLLALFGATILFSHMLSREDYGLYQSVWMYVNLVSVIIGFGVTTVIFSSQPTGLLLFLRKNKRVILPFYIVLWIFTFLIFTFASHQFSIGLKLWVISFMILQTSNTIAETWLIKNGGSVRYFIINLVYGLAFFFWHYLVLVSGFSLEWLVKGLVCFSAGKFLALLTFSMRPDKLSHTAILEKKLFSHWAYNGANDIISVLAKWADKLILIYLLTPAQFAIFFNGSIEIPLFSIFVSFTGSLMMAQMAERLRMRESLAPVFRENFLLLSSLSFPLFFFLFFFSKPVFLLLFGGQYLESLPVFMITILTLPLRINSYGGILQVLGKGKRVTQGSVLDLVICILLIMILYPFWGMRGAAVALVISSMIQIIYYLWHSKHLLGAAWLQLIPVQSLLMRFIVCGVLFWMASYFLNSYSPITKIITGCLLIVTCALIGGKKYFTQNLRAEKGR